LNHAHFVAGRRGPDAEFVLLEESEDFEVDAFCLKFPHNVLDL
jgi:hypothetical protein